MKCCRKDVISARGNAERQGQQQLAEFEQMEKTGGPLFCQMIMKSKVVCPNRGRGTQRANFDFIEHVRMVTRSTKLRVGFKGEFLTFDKFLDYKESQGVDRTSAAEEWLTLEKDEKKPSGQ